jgi:NADH dehydrogenase I D subunit
LSNNIKYFTLNFGPQHPAAHGVLRLILYMRGEVIKYADPHIGLLHRGTEKLLEYRTYLQGIPYFARLDYVSTMSQEHVFCLVVEKLTNLAVSNFNSTIRVIFLELTRILNHLLALTTHALDVGAMTPFLWAFEEREKIMEFYERVSGARLHTTFFRFGGVANNIDKNLLVDINIFCLNFVNRLEELYNVLLNNRIWKERLSFIGIINKDFVKDYSFSGPLLRSSGYNWDLRKLFFYENYNDLKFNVVIGTSGDSLDRFLIRLEEMRESIFLIKQSIKNLSQINFNNNLEDLKIKNLKREDAKNNMEFLINHFKYYSEGIFIEEEDLFISTETPKGEFGVFLEADNSNKPHRVKIRPTGFFHLQGLNSLVYNYLLADVVTVIGTLDLVFGEIDR